MIEVEYRQKLSRFFNDLIFRYRIAESVKKQMDRYLASDFNLIELFATKEEDISRATAVLLNPDGGHGQGTVFLEKYLEGLGVPKDGELERVTVKTEASTDKGRRIDILIETMSTFCFCAYLVTLV